MTTCGLCGGGPSSGPVGFGGAVAHPDRPEVKLHHNDMEPGVVVGWRDVEDPILVTCYVAWTVYGRRPNGGTPLGRGLPPSPWLLLE